MTRIVDVGGHAPYRIAIGDGLLHDGAALAAHVRGRHAMIVSDAHVAPLYARSVAEALQAANPGLRCMVTCIPAGESAKSSGAQRSVCQRNTTCGSPVMAMVWGCARPARARASRTIGTRLMRLPLQCGSRMTSRAA